MLDFLTIAHLADEKAGNISGGQKKLLELGRTMMVDAKIVFLDEVGAGVNRTLLNTIGDAIVRLNKERGYTFCVIEHDMDFIGRLCDPVIVMAEGKVLAEGSADADHGERGGDRGLSRHRAEEQGEGAWLSAAQRPVARGKRLRSRRIFGRDGGAFSRRWRGLQQGYRGRTAKAGGRGMPFLIGEAMTGGYGAGRYPARLHRRGRQGRDRGDRRPERRRQVDRDEGGVRHAATCASGQVRLDGEDITALSPQDRVAKGMAFVPQTQNIFTSMTVEENLEMGAFLRRDDIRATMEQVYDLFPILRDKRRQAAGELSGGQRQQVAVGRALMTQPKVLMLDEPTAGVSPIVMDELFDRIIEVARTGISILMVEQNARQALEIADKGYVLVQGANRYTDTGEALLADPEVRKSFLGG